MRVDDFDFDLPRDLIATHPIEPRDAARLLLIGETIADRHIAELPSLLRAGDVLVANDTRVIPVKLIGRRGQATIEITLHRDLGGGVWRAFAKGAKRLKPNDTVEFGDGFTATVAEKAPEGDVVLRFEQEGADLRVQLERFGQMPLPPYIHRDKSGEARDRHDYQTMFAAHDGAVAAPTAGLHFTPALRAALNEAGIGLETVTLHVGAGTFLPVKVDHTQDHRMHAEYGVITAETAARLNEARARGGRIVSIGTTSLRVLESATGEDGQIMPFAAETSIFITPGYRFRAIDVLLTNFHLPRSTLFMLVSAFAGLEKMKAAYAHAIAQRYRFFSYGDACLLFPKDAA